MAQVFISYAREDVAIAQALRQSLEVCGLTVFLDVSTVIRGKWLETITTEIRDATDFVVLLGEHSLKSIPVEQEVTIAKEAAKSPRPVLLSSLPEERPIWVDWILEHGGVHYDAFDLSTSTNRVLALLDSKPIPVRPGPKPPWKYLLVAGGMTALISAYFAFSSSPMSDAQALKNTKPFVTRGFETLKEKRWVEAQEAFERAERLAPRGPAWEIRRCQWLYNAALAAESGGRLGDAERLYGASGAIVGTDPQIHASLGRVLLAQSKRAAAQKSLERALTLASSWPLWGGTTREAIEAQLKQATDASSPK